MFMCSLDAMEKTIVTIILVLLSVVPLEAVTVNPSLCPTNKIAPHKRIGNWQYGTGRTFGAFYDLLGPGYQQYGPTSDVNDLQEQPQEDDPTDCGEIDDYDENDLSSDVSSITAVDIFSGSGPSGDKSVELSSAASSLILIISIREDAAEEPEPLKMSTAVIDETSGTKVSHRPRPNSPEAIHTTFTSQGNRRQGHRDGPRFLFSSLPNPQNPQRPPNFSSPPHFPPSPNYNFPSNPQSPASQPQRPPQRPPGPPPTDLSQEHSYPSARPPYWSGGLFGANTYRPPLHQNPSDMVKPIHEYSEQSQVPYRPTLVGGPVGHVVGFSPIIPTSQDDPTTSRIFYNRLRPSTPPPNTMYPMRRPRPRNINSSGIFRSFVDLLF